MILRMLQVSAIEATYVSDYIVINPSWVCIKSCSVNR